MTSRDFCFWLQGHFELNGTETIPADKAKIIGNHLNLVFLHEIDPSMPDPDGTFQAAHDGTAADIPVKPSGFGKISSLGKPSGFGNRPPGPDGQILRC